MTTPSGRKVTEAERKKESEKNAINSCHIVPCSASKSLGSKWFFLMSPDHKENYEKRIPHTMVDIVCSEW